MAEIITIDDRFRIGKAYTVREAAKLAKVSQNTVRNWLYGSEAGDYEMEPVFGAKEKKEGEIARVSFLELIELTVAARWRSYGIKLPRVREAYDEARTRYPDIPYPFAHLDLHTVGGHVIEVLREFDAKLNGSRGQRFLVLTSPEQSVLPGIVESELALVDYNTVDRFAEAWHPYGREIPIVVDPHYAAGRPIVLGSNVSVEIIRKRWRNGEKAAYIARDFELPRGDVEAILQRIA